jgi:transposase
MRHLETNTRRQRRASARAAAKGEVFPLVRPDAAGIDVGSRVHYVAVPPELNQPVRSFDCMTEDLRALGNWLRACGVKTVALEATGVYWIPLVEMLEDYGFEVYLVDARQTRNLSGHKTDVKDCRWIQKLHSYGLLAPAFRPEKSITVLRSYWRQRQGLVASCAQQIHLMHKALEQMNVQLHKELSDITGQSGMRIVRAIVAGERDREKLAALCHSGIKCTRAQVARALEGNYRAEHIFALGQALEAHDFFQRQLEACDKALEVQIATVPTHHAQSCEHQPQTRARAKRRKNQPHFDLREQLCRIAGVDLTRVEGIDAMTAFSVVSETGMDMTRFPSEKAFSSWMHICPNNRITGGRVRSRRVRPGVNRAGQALKVAAQSLHHSKSALGAYFRRMKARLGPQKAIVATAHKLARLIYRLLKHGEAYLAQSEAQYHQLTRQRALQQLTRRAQRLGFALVSTATGEVVS